MNEKNANMIISKEAIAEQLKAIKALKATHPEAFEETDSFEKIPTAHYKDELKVKREKVEQLLEQAMNHYKVELMKDALKICKENGLFNPEAEEANRMELGREYSEVDKIMSLFADQEKDWESSAVEPDREEKKYDLAKKSDSLTTKEKFNMLINVKSDLYKAMAIAEARGNEDCLKELLHNCDDRVTKLLSSLLD